MRLQLLENELMSPTQHELMPSFQGLPFLKAQDAHLYCFRVSAIAGVIIIHLPWNHHSHTSQPIQNSSALYFPPQHPQDTVSLTTCAITCKNSLQNIMHCFHLFFISSICLRKLNAIVKVSELSLTMISNVEAINTKAWFTFIYCKRGQI